MAVSATAAARMRTLEYDNFDALSGMLQVLRSIGAAILQGAIQRRASAGRVEFDGTPIAASSVRIGLVHQAFALLSLLTAAENVELAAQVLGGDGDAIRVSAQSCLAAVNLVDRADHLLEELSGGEQQRVAIARAMITEPQLMLADEPTAQLDHDTRETIVAILRRMADDGATVVVATHDPEVAALCDDVVELNSGRVTIPGRHRIAATSGPSPGPRAGNERR